MKLNRTLTFRRVAAASDAKVILLALLSCTLIGCASHEVSKPSGEPVPYSPDIRRDPGVINDAYNTGNPPSDLSPFTPRWGDVRKPY